MKITFSMRVHRGPTVTVAVVETDEGYYYGESKLHPNDDYNREIGDWLALSRALKSFASDIESNANELIDKPKSRVTAFLNSFPEAHA